jgi:hypothetical protein
MARFRRLRGKGRCGAIGASGAAPPAASSLPRWGPARRASPRALDRPALDLAFQLVRACVLGDEERCEALLTSAVVHAAATLGDGEGGASWLLDLLSGLVLAASYLAAKAQLDDGHPTFGELVEEVHATLASFGRNLRGPDGDDRT